MLPSPLFSLSVLPLGHLSSSSPLPQSRPFSSALAFSVTWTVYFLHDFAKALRPSLYSHKRRHCPKLVGETLRHSFRHRNRLARLPCHTAASSTLFSSSLWSLFLFSLDTLALPLISRKWNSIRKDISTDRNDYNRIVVKMLFSKYNLIWKKLIVNWTIGILVKISIILFVGDFNKSIISALYTIIARKILFLWSLATFSLNFEFQSLISFPLQTYSFIPIIIIAEFQTLSLEILSIEQLKTEWSNENRMNVMGRRNRQLRFGDWGRASNEAQSFVSCLEFGAWLAIRLSVDKDLRVAKKLASRSFVR